MKLSETEEWLYRLWSMRSGFDYLGTNPMIGRLRTACATKLLPLLLLTLPAAVQAQFTYTTNNGAITLTGYTGSSGAVTISNFVTGIGDYAFYDCYSLAGVTIPNGVTSLGNYAFYDCLSLTNITIPNSVTSIGNSAFNWCASLAGVTIPNGVASLGDYAFYDCLSLATATIGNSVTNLGVEAFSGCTSLARVYFNGNAPSLGSSVFSGDDKAVGYYLSGTTGWGTTFGGLPTALWPQVQTTDRSFGVQTNQFGFTITGASNLVIVVEACTNLVNPNWSSVGTNTLTGGSSCFGDPQWTNYPARFYRLRSP